MRPKLGNGSPFSKAIVALFLLLLYSVFDTTSWPMSGPLIFICRFSVTFKHLNFLRDFGLPTPYKQYQDEVGADIKQTLQDKGCQPILFIGSGLSQRYFKGPSWIGLLTQLASTCSLIDKNFAFYKQNYASLIDIGEHFSQCFQEWAWGEGVKHFPKDLFESTDGKIYIKYATCEYFQQITPTNLSEDRLRIHQSEIQALRRIRPHSVITTNYDTFADILFENYESIIGQKVLKTNFASVGELFKIHGCVTDPPTLVLTRKDYNEFTRKKKYLSSKLLTYFAEHPLVFLGYQAEDPNIQGIMSDIDEILAGRGELVNNIFFVEWKPGCETMSSLQRERVLVIEGGNSIRVKNIVADSYKWVYDAFASRPELTKVDPKILRALMSRSYELVRCDIPQSPSRLITRNSKGQPKKTDFFRLSTVLQP